MRIEPTLTPAGQLHARVSATEDAPEPALDRVGKAFTASASAGLFALAAQSLEATLPPALAWWREFAARYLTELCHTPEVDGAGLDPLPVPSPSELAALALGMPPMPGAEYATPDALARIWEELDAWVRAEVTSAGRGLAAFLERHARRWHQVGRVCFHLAENRRDPEHPFAFLATYAPTLASGGRVRYRPLGKALQEYAGRQNKRALVKLLTPVHRASEQSSVVRELLESGDIYQPLAWEARQAYRFLKDVPAFEESGVLVRLPDWWRKRPRPRVAVSIGNRRTHGLSAEGMLDFEVEVALGDDRLTPDEWQALKDADDGLVLLRGQWVEVDPARARRDPGALAGRGGREPGRSVVQRRHAVAGWRASGPGGGGRRRGGAEGVVVRPRGPVARRDPGALRDPRTPGGATSTRALKATLRPYQEVGVGWLHLLAGLGLGACLADDMGLGKTIQVLALLLMLKEEQRAARKRKGKPSLLVLPASLLANWKAELERFTPSLAACFVHPSLTAKDDLANDRFRPGRRAPAHRRRAHHLRDAACASRGSSTWIGASSCSTRRRPSRTPRHVRRGRSSACRPGCAGRPDGDARREPAFRSLVAVRLPVPRSARLADAVQGVREGAGGQAGAVRTRRSAGWCNPTSSGA